MFLTLRNYNMQYIIIVSSEKLSTPFNRSTAELHGLSTSSHVVEGGVCDRL